MELNVAYLLGEVGIQEIFMPIAYVGPQFVDDPFYLTFLMARHINYLRYMLAEQRERAIAALAAAVETDYDTWQRHPQDGIERIGRVAVLLCRGPNSKAEEAADAPNAGAAPPANYFAPPRRQTFKSSQNADARQEEGWRGSTQFQMR